MSLDCLLDLDYCIKHYTTNVERSALTLCAPNSKGKITQDLIIYGFDHCLYYRVYEVLCKSTKFEHVYNYENCGYSDSTTLLSGDRAMEKIKVKNYTFPTYCKAGLVSALFESYKRKCHDDPV